MGHYGLPFDFVAKQTTNVVDITMLFILQLTLDQSVHFQIIYLNHKTLKI
jgi:hypothetical protein